jgi:hypothetical protein
MKSITIYRNSRIKLITLFLMLVSIESYSQSCSGSEVTFTLQNITNPTPKTLEFDVYISNSGSTSLKLAALQGALIHDPQLIPFGSTTTFSVITQPNTTGNFTNFNNLEVKYSAESKQLRWTQSPVSLSSGKTVSLPSNKSLRFARFRLTSSLSMTTQLSSKLKPQSSIASGFTTILATVYCNASNNSTALYPKIAEESHTNDNYFGIKGNPNPYFDDFKIEVKTSSDSALNFKVYNMLGKLIENRDVELLDIENQKFGSNYDSGIYNIIITQANNEQIIRMIKR